MLKIWKNAENATAKNVQNSKVFEILPLPFCRFTKIDTCKYIQGSQRLTWVNSMV